MAETVSQSACPKGANAYVLREGDTLASVAARYGVTEEDIRRINPGISAAPAPGETICVPSLRCPEGTLYVVHRGDTFTSIAKAFGITVAQLSAANPFVDPDVIAIGQVICVPVREEKPEPEPEPEKPVEPEKPETGADIVINNTNNISVCIQNVVQYEVRPGESYADLLIRTGLSYLLFKLFNPHLLPGNLLVGQKYFAPKDDLCCAPVSAGRSYLLQSGENLQTAAQALGVSVGALLRSNPHLSPADFVEGTSVRY